jgi:hypothetical protein
VETALIRLRVRGQAADAYITALCSGPLPLRRRARPAKTSAAPRGASMCVRQRECGGRGGMVCPLLCYARNTRQRQGISRRECAGASLCVGQPQCGGRGGMFCLLCPCAVLPVQHALCCTSSRLVGRAAQVHVLSGQDVLKKFVLSGKCCTRARLVWEVLHKGTRHRIDTLTHAHSHVVWLGLQPQRRRPPQARTGWPTKRATTAKTSSRKWVCMHVRVVVYDVCHVCMLGLCYICLSDCVRECLCPYLCIEYGVYV